MHADKTTQYDLSIFHHEEAQSVFHHLNFTHTNGGREYLHHILSSPLDSVPAITNVQHTIAHLIQVADRWPTTVSNGTLMVMEKFFETAIETPPHQPGPISSFYYKLINGPDYSLIKYSVEHFIHFVQGLDHVAQLLTGSNSSLLQTWSARIEMLLHKPYLHEMLAWDKNDPPLTPSQVLTYGNFIRSHFKHSTYQLIEIYSKLDAYLSLAIVSIRYNFHFPVFEDSITPFLEAEDLFHVQLSTPVAYTIHLDQQKNFLFLTGANMGGKSTFIKALGISVYLAHLGMGVPATSMRLSLFDGILSNIQVVDNIVKGESFFFNEVQRIKSTVEKLSDGKKWLILIDELFKGTNQQDAIKCSITVIEGLRKMNNALFVLSTHLYEIGTELQHHDNILFRYFETSIIDDQLQFSYQLKEGISNDRLGYLILKREGVVDLLNQL